MRISKVLLPLLVASAATAVGTMGDVAAAETAAPDGYVRVVDETGTIAMSVPLSWQVDIDSVDYGDGFVRPNIGAAGDGLIVEFTADPHESTLTPWNGSCDPTYECSVLLSSQPYDDGTFVGYRQLIEECCAGGPFELVVANVAGGDVFTARVLVDYGETRDPAEVAVFDTILSTLEPVGAAYPAEQPSDNLPPAVVDPAAPIWPYGPFWNVPRLGSEPVRGSGCGSQGQIGDVIPDGLWAGFVTNEATPTIAIDLLCIFAGAAAQHVIGEGTANIVNDNPDYLVVNNSTRLRTVPAAPGIVLRDSAVVDGECLENPTAAHNPSPTRQAWVRIVNGEVSWVLWGCGFPAGPAAPQSANLPPAYPDYSDGVGSVWPYGPFWNVPQLGSEPVRGSGCGASGQLGATIPDGLWAGFVTGYDAASNTVGIDVLCIFSGDTAQAVIAEGTANIINNEPDYLIVNNNPQVRVMPSGLAAIITGQIDGAGQCVEGTHHSPEAVHEIAARTIQQAWIRIDNGVVTWIFYGC
jgi:hypothetical protein